MGTDYLIRRAIRKAVKEGTEQEQLEEMLVNVIGIYREESDVEDRQAQNKFLQDCLKNALEVA